MRISTEHVWLFRQVARDQKQTPINGSMCRKTEEREGNGKTTGERRAYTAHLWTLRPWNQLVGEKKLGGVDGAKSGRQIGLHYIIHM